MAVIAFVNPKGGAGKSTSAVVLATQLAKNGADVEIIDADPNNAISQWAKLGCPKNISVVAGISEATVIDQIERSSTQSTFVIVDLEGTASMMVGYAISRADLVIVPIQGSQLDAVQGMKAIKLVKQQEKAFGRSIPFAVLFTRTSVAIRPRTFSFIQESFEKNSVRTFVSHLHERDAFKSLFSFGGGLEELDPKQVSRVPEAIANAHAFALEVTMLLRESRNGLSGERKELPEGAGDSV